MVNVNSSFYLINTAYRNRYSWYDNWLTSALILISHCIVQDITIKSWQYPQNNQLQPVLLSIKDNTNNTKFRSCLFIKRYTVYKHCSDFCILRITQTSQACVVLLFYNWVYWVRILSAKINLHYHWNSNMCSRSNTKVSN